MATFAENITALRKELNRKRQEVADDLGISRSSLEYYEKGKRRPDIDVLAKFADYYGVSADFLIGRTSAKTTDKDLRFVCEYTGLNDVTVAKLHRNIGKPTNHCNQTIDYFLSDRAEFVFISFSEELKNYREAVTLYSAFIGKLDTMDVGYFQNTYNDRVNDVALSEYRIQKTAERLMEIFGDPEKSISQDEIEFTKRLISFKMKESLSDGQEEGDNNAYNPKAQE